MTFIRENVSLAPYTTIRVGGSARYFFSVYTDNEVREAVRFAHAKNLPFFILGGGSNVIFLDEGFAGVIIKTEIPDITFKEENGYIIVEAGAGVLWDNLVLESVARSLWGIENLSVIPGTVGAAPVQNIGAYGVEVKDTIEWVRVYDTQKDTFTTLSRDECEFTYRTSIFKKSAGKKLVVTRVAFRLSKNGTSNLGYGDIAKYFSGRSSDTISAPEMREAIIKIRGKKLPNPQTLPNAGSFFKNPVVSKDLYLKIQNTFPDISGHQEGSGVKLSAARLIEACGWKGIRHKNAGITKEHALVIANYGSASARDIKELADTVTRDVFARTGVTLLPEVEFVK